jgi:gas vesicle protein
MRNVWKGLIVGGLTGVAAGVVLDSLGRASRTAAAIGDQVRDLAPDAGRWVQTVTDKAGEWLHDVDVPDHVRTAAVRVKESDAAGRVVEVGNDVSSAARQVSAKNV